MKAVTFVFKGVNACTYQSRAYREDRRPDLYYYDIQGMGLPCNVALLVMVDHWGTIVTDAPIQFDKGVIVLDEDEVKNICNNLYAYA